MTARSHGGLIAAPVVDSNIAGSVKLWLAVGVMMLIEIAALVDRGALNLLIGPVTESLKLSKEEGELLFGFHIALIYGATTLLIGHFVDRYNRQRILLSCAITFATLTALSGFADNFAELMVIRLGIGMAASAVIPVAYSIIQSSFQIGRRARGFGVIQLGGALGTIASSLIVGGLVRMVLRSSLSDLTSYGIRYPWQTVMFLIGLAGVPVALLMLFIDEPPRADGRVISQYGRSQEQVDGSIGSMLLFVHRNRYFYGPLTMTYTALGMGLYAYLVWLPQAIHNHWGIAISDIGVALGGVQAVGAAFGFIGVGILMDRYSRRGSLVMIPVSGGAAAIAGGIGLAVVSQTSSIPLLWALYAASWVGICWATVSASVALAAVTPNRIIGKIAACSTILIGLVGGGSGTALVGMAAGSAFSGPNALGDALSMIGGTMLVVGGIAQLWVAYGMDHVAEARPTLI